MDLGSRGQHVAVLYPSALRMCGATTQMLLAFAVMIMVGGLTFHVAGNNIKKFLSHFYMEELHLYELFYDLS